jgi:hypothetical protein
MNDDFVTQAIEKDRYLKAKKLIDQFETELKRELTRIGDAFAESNRDHFADDVEADWNNSSFGKTLAFARIDLEMDRVVSESNPKNLVLNLSTRWLEADAYGHPDHEGALCVASYKIKYASAEDHQEVVTATKEGDWEIEPARDVYNNSEGIFYIPIESAQELTAAYDRLNEHFSEHVAMYGIPASEV